VAVYQARLGNDSEETLVTASVTEEALSSPHVAEALASLTTADWFGSWPGVVRAPALGLCVQAFPADDDLPALAAAVDLSGGGPLAAVLGGLTAGPHTNRADVLEPAVAEVIRYRPGSRCVLRYRVPSKGAPGGLSCRGGQTVLFGKLYRSRDDARAVHTLAVALWRRAEDDGTGYVARPVALLADLALVISEAARGDHNGIAVTGRTLLSPASGSAGCDAAVAAGEALAWWHSNPEVPSGPSRTARRESGRTRRRLDHLAVAVPELAPTLRELNDSLACALDDLRSGRPRAVHGAFRPNQLVFVRAEPTVTDFDDAGVGDPAADVGSFCAHLRPPRWWQADARRLGWYETARRAFTDRYHTAMVATGSTSFEVDATLRRALLFEAASLVRMAGHGSRHLSSARPKDVAAVLGEARGCVRAFIANEIDESRPDGSTPNRVRT
jgi:hypothetical protein